MNFDSFPSSARGETNIHPSFPTVFSLENIRHTSLSLSRLRYTSIRCTNISETPSNLLTRRRGPVFPCCVSLLRPRAFQGKTSTRVYARRCCFDRRTEGRKEERKETTVEKSERADTSAVKKNRAVVSSDVYDTTTMFCGDASSRASRNGPRDSADFLSLSLSLRISRRRSLRLTIPCEALACPARYYIGRHFRAVYQGAFSK